MGESRSGPTFVVAVPRAKAGERLDKVLAEDRPDISRSRLQVLIRGGRVSLDGGPTRWRTTVLGDPDYRVRAGDRIRVSIPAPAPAHPRPEAVALDVVFEDRDLIVVNKPAGLVVHPAPGHPDGTLVNALLHHCRGDLAEFGGVSRPGIVHRLDKDTSGLIVAAKTDSAHRSLARQFAAHGVDRAYLALVWGVPRPQSGELRGNIGRSSRNRKKMAVVQRGGKPALTRYKLVRTVGRRAGLLECRPLTGRTHQIRVHLARAGHPIVGDPLYGGGVNARLASLRREPMASVPGRKHQSLHAFLIGFEHPRSGNPHRFEVPCPLDINELICFLDEV